MIPLIKVEITVSYGVPPLAVRVRGRGAGRTAAEALAVAIIDTLPRAHVTLLDVIRNARRLVAGTARVFLPGPHIGQTVAGDRPS